MPSINSRWYDAFREHWRVVALSLALVLGMALFSTMNAPVASADACGTQPDWWTTDYVSWLSCEITNGGATASITQVVSPVLDYIDSDIQTLQSVVNGTLNTINTTLNGLPASIATAMKNALLPNSTDYQPLTNEWATIQNTDSIKTVTTSWAAVQQFTTAMQDLTTTSSSVLPTGSYTFQGTTYAVSAPDGVMTGIGWFFIWLSNGGLTIPVLYGLEDAILSLVLAGSILRDLGVEIGQVTPTVRAFDMALGDGARERNNRDAVKNWRSFIADGRNPHERGLRRQAARSATFNREKF